MKSKIIIISLLLLLSACSSQEAKISFKKTKFQFEYGETIEIPASQLTDSDDKEVLESMNVETDKLSRDKNYIAVGTYKTRVTYKLNGKEKVKFINVTISDTTVPKITLKQETIEVDQHTESIDYNEIVEASDLAGVTLTYDDSTVNLEEPGEYSVGIKATDSNGNQSESTIKVIVKEVVKETPQPQDTSSNNSNNAPETTPTSSGPYYIGDIIVVNKKHSLPQTYAPGENVTAGNAVRQMIADMQTQGFDISNSYSGYRSYEYQAQLYQSYVNSHGQATADTFSARAGYSEHQTGLAFDLLHTNGTLVTNANEANWIAQNAHRYGFIVRYQAGKESITGYQAEPWHLRYVGSQAESIYNSGLTLEEYLGVPGGGY